MSTLSEVNANPLLCAGHLKPSLYLLTDIWRMFERRKGKETDLIQNLGVKKILMCVSLLFYCLFLAL